jgi:DNA-nicking Smr family endonuclease
MATVTTPTEEDVRLFRNAAGTVTPVKQNQVRIPRRRPAPVPLQRLADESHVIDEMAAGTADADGLETGEELLYRRNGLQDRQFRKLKTGQLSIQAELDLHGLNVSAAKQRVADFLGHCRTEGKYCVRIIHGKGLGSPNREPVLKRHLGHWLQQRKDVLAFCSARPVDGGTGAVYVLLRKAN